MTEEVPEMPRDPADFPIIAFPVITVAATLRLAFSLKNPEERDRAARVVEAAKKLLIDGGAAVEIQFDGGQ